MQCSNYWGLSAELIVYKPKHIILARSHNPRWQLVWYWPYWLLTLNDREVCGIPSCTDFVPSQIAPLILLWSSNVGRLTPVLLQQPAVVRYHLHWMISPCAIIQEALVPCKATLSVLLQHNKKRSFRRTRICLIIWGVSLSFTKNCIIVRHWICDTCVILLDTSCLKCFQFKTILRKKYFLYTTLNKTRTSKVLLLSSRTSIYVRPGNFCVALVVVYVLICNNYRV